MIIFLFGVEVRIYCHVHILLSVQAQFVPMMLSINWRTGFIVTLYLYSHSTHNYLDLSVIFIMVGGAHFPVCWLKNILH